MRAPRYVAAVACASVSMVALTASPAGAAPTPSPRVTPAATPAPVRTPAADSVPATPHPLPTGFPRPRPDQTPANTPIQRKYVELGGVSGRLGLPVDAEVDIAGGRMRRYLGGDIYYSQASGAHVVWGAILGTLRAQGGPSGVLGFPTTDEFGGLPGVLVQVFTRGRILWTQQTGAHEVHGTIETKYGQLGWERGSLGVPVTDQFHGNDGGRSKLNDFQNGTIIAHPETGTHEIGGGNRWRWREMGGEGGVLGAPTSDGFNGANGARVNRMQRGLIIWTPRTFSYAVKGAILGKYAEWGWEGGRLGAPTGQEYAEGGRTYQDFERGRIFIDNGAVKVEYHFVDAYVRNVTNDDVAWTYRTGCPVGPGALRVIEMNFTGYDSSMLRGQMIVRDYEVGRVIDAFQQGNFGGDRVWSMLNPNAFGGDDPTMMAANNTSAFNCRRVTGNPYAMSPHSYGTAIDINTVQNPYFDGRRWWPDNGLLWRDRNRRDIGMLFSWSPMTHGFTDRGYTWGGNWADRDYQHFQR